MSPCLDIVKTKFHLLRSFLTLPLKIKKCQALIKFLVGMDFLIKTYCSSTKKKLKHLQLATACVFIIPIVIIPRPFTALCTFNNACGQKLFEVKCVRCPAGIADNHPVGNNMITLYKSKFSK